MLKLIKINFKNDTKYQHLFGGNSDTVKMKSGLVILKPGKNVGEHITENKEEAIIVLSGRAEIINNGSTIEAQKNSIVYIPPETSHNVKNIGKSLLRYVYVVCSL